MSLWLRQKIQTVSRPTDLIQPNPFIQVVVLVLENDQGDVLLTQRKANVHLANYWEFPGGKVENNETLLEALDRECFEELNYQPRSTQKILTIKHNYPEISVELHVYHEVNANPIVHAAEAQTMQWTSKSYLPNLNLPAANQAIVNYLINNT